MFKDHINRIKIVNKPHGQQKIGIILVPVARRGNDIC